MYIMMSRSGSADSRVRSWAITSLAEASSIWTPRKMMRSSNILLYGLDSLTPYDVRSTNRSEEHTSELQSRFDLVCRLLLEKKNVPLPDLDDLLPILKIPCKNKSLANT